MDGFTLIEMTQSSIALYLIVIIPVLSFHFATPVFDSLRGIIEAGKAQSAHSVGRLSNIKHYRREAWTAFAYLFTLAITIAAFFLIISSRYVGFGADGAKINIAFTFALSLLAFDFIIYFVIFCDWYCAKNGWLTLSERVFKKYHAWLSAFVIATISVGALMLEMSGDALEGLIFNNQTIIQLGEGSSG